MVVTALPAAAASGNKTVVVIATADGNMLMTSWTLGGAGTPWASVNVSGPVRYTDTTITPAVSFSGAKLWLGIKSSSVIAGGIYETLQLPDGSFQPWVRIPGLATDVSLAANDGNGAIGYPIMAALAAPPDRLTYINPFLGDQPPPGSWRPLDPSPITTLSPAISIVNQGKYMFLAVPVINLGGPNSRLILYQGSTLNPDQLSSSYTGFDTNLSPAMAAAHNRTVIVAVDASGAIFYNWWDFGGGGHGWIPLGTNVKTSARPAVSLVDNGNYMFILATGEDGILYLNQGIVGGAIVGWEQVWNPNPPAKDGE
jgi:hypothetical protein